MERIGAGEAEVSAREAEVLAALGEHLTNAEIATRLFISVRTVESHVSALLRKLGAADRRALAALAPARAVPVAAPGSPGATRLPAALTPFVGRAVEAAELAAAVTANRLVTAVGPGGVGKTRLAVSVAAAVADRFPDGVWFVDLVPVTDRSAIPATVAAAFGLGEQQGRSALATVLTWLADRKSLLVLDNCEHLLDDVALLVERLLAECAGVTVLATSRVRLQLPFETAWPVHGLTLPGPGPEGGAGDAVALFLARAAATGVPVATADHDGVARICRSLDGVALAIELAAARLPAVGLDGLEAGLADRLPLLTGTRRLDDRHRSLRSTLDWSYALLHGQAQAVLRRVSVFAGPFRTEAAAEVAAGAPVDGRDLGPALAALADHNLVTPVAGAGGTRYRVLETIRQYGAELAAQAGELDGCRARHLRWCVDAGEALRIEHPAEEASWRAAVDGLTDELRSAAVWASAQPERRAEAHAVVTLLAALSHRRGLPGEAQRGYEQAAQLAGSERHAAVALHHAAGSAAARIDPDDAVRLHRAAATAALAAGEATWAARDLAQAAELVNRAYGCFAVLPPDGTAAELIREARRLAPGDPAAQARLAVAEAFDGSEWEPRTAQLSDHALEQARRSGDPLVESAALDRITTVHLSEGRLRAALTAALRRTEILAPLPVDADMGFELPDAYVMATECAIGAGDLALARRLAEHIRDESLHHDDGAQATARLLLVTAVSGDWDDTLAAARQFREGWERAGRPRAADLRRAAGAAAAVHGLRGDLPGRDEWLAVVEALNPPHRGPRDARAYEFFDALLLLHRGQPEQALERLAAPPDRPRGWLTGLWQPWCVALGAEAAVLSGDPGASERVRAARGVVADNPITAAVVARAAALAAHDPDGVLGAAADLEAAGCRYQWARSLVLAGGTHRARGERAMAAMGATTGH